MTQHARSAWAVALLIVAACGCSSGASNATKHSTKPSTTSTSATTVPESTTTSPPTTVPPLATIGTLPSQLNATFAVLLTTSDVHRGDQAGFWYLTLTPRAGYAFGRVPSDPGQNTGVLTVSGGTVTLSAERGEGPCDGAGTYRWTAAGDALTFTVVNNPCTVRMQQTTAKPYRRCSGGPNTCVQPS